MEKAVPAGIETPTPRGTKHSHDQDARRLLAASSGEEYRLRTTSTLHYVGAYHSSNTLSVDENMIQYLQENIRDTRFNDECDNKMRG